MLFGAFAVGITIALTTSLPGMVGLPQDTPAAIMALVAGAIGVSMQGDDPQAIYSTVVAAISLTSILTAIFFLLLGKFRASGFVRYIPYPVVGGFLAGTGYLLSIGRVWRDGGGFHPFRPAQVIRYRKSDSLGARRYFCGHTSSSLTALEPLSDYTGRIDRGNRSVLWLSLDCRHSCQRSGQPGLAVGAFSVGWALSTSHTLFLLR